MGCWLGIALPAAWKAGNVAAFLAQLPSVKVMLAVIFAWMLFGIVSLLIRHRHRKLAKLAA